VTAMLVIEEIKRHKNKEHQRFLCEVIHRDEGYLVVRFVSQEDGLIKDIVIKTGSTTIGHYWTDRGYVLWRMFNPGGRLAGTLFHICKDVMITEQKVEYLDLIVDLWISPDGMVRILDEDELQECQKAALLSNDEINWIEQQKNIVLQNHHHIIKELWGPA
jgi:hypothetical protein